MSYTPTVQETTEPMPNKTQTPPPLHSFVLMKFSDVWGKKDNIKEISKLICNIQECEVTYFQTVKKEDQCQEGDIKLDILTGT